MCVARLARVNAPALVRPSPPVVPEEQVVFCVMMLALVVEGWWWWWVGGGGGLCGIVSLSLFPLRPTLSPLLLGSESLTGMVAGKKRKVLGRRRQADGRGDVK